MRRRGLRDSSNSNSLTTKINTLQSSLLTWWQSLPARDQLALSVLVVFFIVLIGGYGGYSVHQAAKDSKAEYQQQVTDYFWLRSQAGNISASATNGSGADSEALSASNINSLLSNAGITNAQVVAVGENVQLSFTHPSQASVSSSLSALEQQGWQFAQLTIQQDTITKQLQVQAMLTSRI